MLDINNVDRNVHPAALMHAEEYRKGKISRREFLTRATALGVASTAAYGLIGATAPAEAAGHQQGGTLLHQMEVRGLKEPRVYDWPQIANLMRGNFEYLVEYNNDGSLRGILLESWSANDDATQFTLNVRKGVTYATLSMIGSVTMAKMSTFSSKRHSTEDSLKTLKYKVAYLLED